MSSKILSKTAQEQSAPINWAVWGGAAGEPSFQMNFSANTPQAAVPVETPPQPVVDVEMVARLQEQVAQLQMEAVRREEQARQMAYREGEMAGNQAALAQLQPVLTRLGRTVEELAGLRRRFRSEAEKDVIKLTLAIARRVLHREINMDPEAMLGLIRVALEQIELRELHHIRLHPVDAPAVERHLAAAGIPDRVQVVADSTLERGAAIFETTRGNLDASISTQLEEITRGFGDILERSR